MMQLRPRRAISYRAAAITAAVGALAAASLLLMPALPVVHQVTAHSDQSDHANQPGDCAPTTDCFLCLHFDQDGSCEATIVPALYADRLVAPIALPIQPATTTGAFRAATARSPPASC